jgi:hypothetical protein
MVRNAVYRSLQQIKAIAEDVARETARNRETTKERIISGFRGFVVRGHDILAVIVARWSPWIRARACERTIAPPPASQLVGSRGRYQRP